MFVTVKPTEVHEILGKYILADGFDLVVDLERSHGSFLYDARTETEYIDFFSFFASMPIGYNHPDMNNEEFVNFIGRVALNKPSNSDLYTTYYAEFVKTMGEVAKPDYLKYMFFIDGGALAVENALKTAFDWKVRKNLAAGKGEKGYKVIHFKEAFHGRTGYTLSLTNTADPRKYMYFPRFDWPRLDNPKLRFPVTPEVEEDVRRREEEVFKKIEEICEKEGDDIAALIIEPIQAEGGDNHFRPEFFKGLRELADRYDFLLIFDEVQTGGGLTGKMWAHEHFDVRPDIISFGKKFQTCGIMAGERIDEVENNVFKESSRINSTWGGNLVDMVRSTMYLRIIEKENLVENARAMGEKLMKGLEELNKKHGVMSNLRGKGLFIAFDLPTPEKRDEFLKVLKEKYRTLLLPCGHVSVRFRPFLDVKEDVIAEALKRIDGALSEM